MRPDPWAHGSHKFAVRDTTSHYEFVRNPVFLARFAGLWSAEFQRPRCSELAETHNGIACSVRLVKLR